MPHKNEVKWIPQEDILSFEEIIRITKVLCSLGIGLYDMVVLDRKMSKMNPIYLHKGFKKNI
jgi:hypothetical protein